MADKSTPMQLSGAEKTAILLLSVGDEHAAKIFALMEEDEIKEVSYAMSNLGPIKPEVIERLIHDFSSEMNSSMSFVGNIANT